MTPREFLAAVLPSVGRYVFLSINKGSPHQTFNDEIDPLLLQAQKADVVRADAYFAVGGFGSEDNRKRDNTRALASFFLDIDAGPGKGYSDSRAALQALGQFCGSTGLPEPIVVRSGNGIHVYWPLSTPIDPTTWYRTATALKTLCTNQGLLADHSVTADTSRILRVPGTHNYKDPDNPKLVKVLPWNGTPTDFETFAALVGAPTYKPPTTTTFNLPGVPLTPRAANVALVQNTTQSFKKLVAATISGNGCAQLQHYITNPTQQNMEPLWRDLISWTKCCVDGEKWARRLSEAHPYDEQRMWTKWNASNGPVGCEHVNQHNPGICTKCPKWGKTINPLSMAAILKEAPKPVPTPVLMEAQPEENPVSNLLPMPKGYGWGANGGVFRVFKDMNKDGSFSERTVTVVPYNLAVVSVRDQEDIGSSVHLFADMPGGRREFVIPSNIITSKSETVKALADKGILSAGMGEAENALYAYIRTMVAEHTFQRATQHVPDTYGWQKDGSFVLNNKRFFPDGVVSSVAIDRNLFNLHNITQPIGHLSKWREVISIFRDMQRYDILLGMLASFGAPLMELVSGGLNGLVIHMQSPNSGTGKSVSLALAGSVFGHPQRYGVNVNTSDVTMQHRMGMLHSLPLIVDEVTTRMRDVKGGDISWINRLLMDITIGKGKERLESTTISERKNSTTWSTLALLSSNTSIVDSLNSRSYTTQGEMMRLLEIEMHTKLDLNGSAELLEAINTNYGIAGAKYIQWLVRNKQEALATFQRVKDELGNDGVFTSEERFWLNGLAAMLTGGALAADATKADIVDLPLNDLKNFAVDLVKHAREAVAENANDAVGLLVGFLQNNYGKLLILRKDNNESRIRLGLKELVDETLARSEIKGRIEILPDKAVIYIDRKEFNSYCSRVNFSSRTLLQRLTNAGFGVGETMKSMFADTKIDIPVRVKVIRLELDKARYEQIAGVETAQ